MLTLDDSPSSPTNLEPTAAITMKQQGCAHEQQDSDDKNFKNYAKFSREEKAKLGFACHGHVGTSLPCTPIASHSMSWEDTKEADEVRKRGR
jgi:hypothetical protein